MRDFEDFPPEEAAHVMRGGPESDFWTSGPRYSRTSARPESALSLPPGAQPSLLRGVLTKLLFVTLFSAALALLAYEASIVVGFSWPALLRGK